MDWLPVVTFTMQEINKNGGILGPLVLLLLPNRLSIYPDGQVDQSIQGLGLISSSQMII